MKKLMIVGVILVLVVAGCSAKTVAPSYTTVTGVVQSVTTLQDSKGTFSTTLIMQNGDNYRLAGDAQLTPHQKYSLTLTSVDDVNGDYVLVSAK